MGRMVFQSGTVVLAATLGMVVVFATPAAANEEGRVYVQGLLGGISPADSPDSLSGKTTYRRGYSASVAAGYGLTDTVRLEAEASRSKVAIDTIMLPSVNSGVPQKASGRVTSTTIIANAYYDFSTGWTLRPYVGVGIGRAQVAIGDSRVPGITGTRDKDQVMAWQGKLGVSYQLNDNVSAVADYKYFNTRKLSFTSKTGTAYTTDGAQSHTFGIGLRYAF